MSFRDYFDEEKGIDYSKSVTFLSKSAGQESKALLALLKHNPKFRKKFTTGQIVLIMSDTGDEHPETYEELFGDTLQMSKDMNFPLYFITSKKEEDYEEGERVFTPGIYLNGEHISSETFHTKSWTSLAAKYKQNSTCGSALFSKTCTDGLKIQPIYKFVEWYLKRTYPELEYGKRSKSILYSYREKYGMIKMMIGFSKGEEGRKRTLQKKIISVMNGSESILIKNPMYTNWMEENVMTTYPLIEIGMDRQGTQDYLTEHGYSIPLPSNCMRCPFTSHKELIWLDQNYPEKYDEWVEFEANKLEKYKHKGKANKGVYGKLNKDGTVYTLENALTYAKQRYIGMSSREIHDYKMSHGHCVKSKY